MVSIKPKKVWIVKFVSLDALFAFEEEKRIKINNDIIRNQHETLFYYDKKIYIGDGYYLLEFGVYGY